MSKRSGASDYDVGYRKPPSKTRFQKGRSGNPKGRPRGRKKELPYEAVLGQMVTVREDGIERRVTAAEAFLLHLSKKGLEGDSAAARVTMAALEEARAAQRARPTNEKLVIEIIPVAPGSVNSALTALRMAKILDRFRPTARTTLEPWIVQKALDRLRDKPLSLEQQETVFRATRTPHKVKWPAWWEFNG